jgi:hypothetical protein
LPWGHFVADTTRAKPAIVKIRHDTFIKVAKTGKRAAKPPVVQNKVARVTAAQYQMAICWYVANRDGPMGYQKPSTDKTPPKARVLPINRRAWAGCLALGPPGSLTSVTLLTIHNT